MVRKVEQILDRIFFLRREPEKGWPLWKRAIFFGWRIFLLLCASVCMGVLLLGFAYGAYTWDVYLSYLHNSTLLLLNILPVTVLILLFYGITGRAWAAFLAGSLLTGGLSIANYYKIFFRNDPLYFEDLFIIREAQAMLGRGHYELFIDKRILVTILCTALGTGLLLLLARGRFGGWRGRLSMTVGAVLASAILMNVSLDNKVYDAIENYDHLNRWAFTENYVAHGFLYPFLHSVKEAIETPPDGYSAAKASEILSAYTDQDIPEERKISVIAIMREAYADFSRYHVEGLDEHTYDFYHSLEAESYTGNLLTNIFAGGTIDTERCFLTGNYRVRNFRESINSYLWYLREQGYRVEGSHPNYSWYYNRLNINQYMGFEDYRYLEGDFDTLADRIVLLPDSVLLPEIYADYIANKATGKPYFSFTVNIETHGPYETAIPGERQYLTGGSYTQECRNAMDNYLTALTNTDEALEQLVNALREDPEPVVLVTFGDHLPWMGDGNIFYDEMDVDLDLSTAEGFRNYYTTRYLIWANDAAKEVLGHDVAGEGPEISPCYLMNLLFQQIGWEGPAFLQAMDDMMEVFPVVTTTGRYVVDGVLTEKIPESRQSLFRDFQYLQQYWRSEFLFH